MNWDRIGRKIREERKKRDLSQDKLARKAGITRQPLSKVERGHIPLVSVAAFDRVLSVLDLEIELKPRKKKEPGELWTPEELLE